MKATFVIKHPDFKGVKLHDVEIDAEPQVESIVHLRVGDDRSCPMRVIESVSVLEMIGEQGTFTREITLVPRDGAPQPNRGKR